MSDASAPSGTFVYDGDCAFCTMCVRFIERRVPNDATVVPWQWTDLAALGLTRDQAMTAVQWVPADTAGPSAGPAAIAALLRTSNPLWRAAGAVLGLRPVTALAWPVYRWIADNRHRLPGGTAACAVPPAAAPTH